MFNRLDLAVEYAGYTTRTIIVLTMVDLEYDVTVASRVSWIR